MSHASSGVQGRRLPGEEGVWMFVLGDLVIFAIFFVTYLVYRAEAPGAYAAGQASLNVTIGTLNTLALLTSSWLVARAVKTARVGAAFKARPQLVMAIGFGIAFLAGKITEYVQKARGGVGAEEAEFFMFYFVFTGIHFVHVLIGLVLLSLLAASIKTDTLVAGRLRLLEGGGVYWHMVDILWIVLFTLFYLIR
ncbi:MAG: cytochrome c oxidase subunit 3 [Pseudomonadota bacterium]